MKTQRIASMSGGLLASLLVVLMLLATTACQEDDFIYTEDLTETEALYTGNVMTQRFWINPDGGTVYLFDGVMEVIVPKGAVAKSTQFTMATFPVDHLDLDGYNMYNRGFSLQGETPGQMFPNGITLKIKYDLAPFNWLKSLPADEEDLKIFWVSPTLYSYERVVPAGNCCVDCNCKIIKGCVGKCGFYVVGEN